jgi:hypothetical protein
MPLFMVDLLGIDRIIVAYIHLKCNNITNKISGTVRGDICRTKRTPVTCDL